MARRNITEIANELNQLRVLDISNNSLRSFYGMQLNLENLLVLNASRNQFAPEFDHFRLKYLRNLFDTTPNLQHIDFSFNGIDMFDEDVVSK